jgi:cytochrome c biogenesis protein CcmG, thiol:disulfide interchange protein DsbE
MKRALVLLAAVALVAVVVVGYAQSRSGSTSGGPPKARHPSANEVREAFQGSPRELVAVHAQANQLLGGGGRALDARLAELRAGRTPAVVNVWAAWCAPCRFELPVFQDQALKHGAKIAFLGVDVNDNRADAQRLLGQIPLTYPSYTDPRKKIAQSYQLVGTPSTIFFDARGTQRYIHSGPYETVADLDADIRRYARQ